ncbi:MAG: hypothetical protein LBC72_02275 [Spirochaetaceae bacterium]|nr:hypothetical protein [Spirochaetaceae bacterium]
MRLFIRHGMLAAFFFAGVLLNAQQRRDFYVDAGAGTGTSVVSFADTVPGNWALEDSWFASAAVGWSPFLRWLYLAVSAHYGVEAVSLDAQSLRFSLLNFSGGFRIYPLPSRKYFQLGLAAGPSFLEFETAAAGPAVPAARFTGMTFTGIFAYDFSRELLGPTALFGSQIAFTLLDNDWLMQAGVFAKVALKGISGKNAAISIVDDTAQMVIVFPFVAALSSAVMCWTAYRFLAAGDRSHVK